MRLGVGRSLIRSASPTTFSPREREEARTSSQSDLPHEHIAEGAVRRVGPSPTGEGWGEGSREARLGVGRSLIRRASPTTFSRREKGGSMNSIAIRVTARTWSSPLLLGERGWGEGSCVVREGPLIRASYARHLLPEGEERLYRTKVYRKRSPSAAIRAGGGTRKMDRQDKRAGVSDLRPENADATARPARGQCPRWWTSPARGIAVRDASCRRLRPPAGPASGS